MPIPGRPPTLRGGVPPSLLPSDGVGELVYRGPNVMMGYAHGPDDLALGKTVETLRTGDIARRAPDGLFEVVGRSSRFVKLYGLRIDLHRVEAELRTQGVMAFCVNDDDRLLVAAAGRHDERDVQRAAAEIAAAFPSAPCAHVTVDELPLLSSGKPDYQTVRRLARVAEASRGRRTCASCSPTCCRWIATTIDPDASFVDLGGNSLSYVAMTVRLERAIGQLPPDWQRMTLRQLQSISRPRAARVGGDAGDQRRIARRGDRAHRRIARRAVRMWGGAHLLLGIAGYNFGRFCLTPVPRTDRVRHLRNTIAWIAVPSLVWVAVALMLTDDYTWTNLLLANKFLGPHDSMTAGRLWFVEVLVWTLVALALVFWLPIMDRVERRLPFAVAAAFLAVGLALRYDILGLHLGDDAWFTMLAFWFFAIGWAAVEGVDGTAADRRHGRAGRQPSRVLRHRLARGDGDWRPGAAHLAADDPVPVGVDRRGGRAGGGLAVHLPGALPGVCVVRRLSGPRGRRVDRRRGAAHLLW